jgi:hypothetical protein
MTISEYPGRTGAKRTWWIWLAICLSVAVVHLLTLEFDPIILQDEVQILDSGRTVWEPSSDWALSWNVQKSFPVLTWSFIGSGLQDLAYRLSAPSLLGPRLMSMLAGIAAATCLLGWLLARCTPRTAAVVISLIFLLDPIFSNIYRRGRIDGWAIAACLAACWLLCLSSERKKNGQAVRIPVFFAGVLTGVSPFLWATAPMLFPLVLLELFYLLKVEIGQSGSKFMNWATSSMLLFIIGGLLLGLIVLAPILLHWEHYWPAMITMVDIQKHAAVIQNSTFDLLFVYDPLMVIAVVASFFIRRELGLFVMLIIAYFIMIRTMVYLPRVLYLLPYFMLMIAGATTTVKGLVYAPRRKILMGVVVGLLLIWNAGSLFLVRTYVATEKLPGNDSTQIYNAFRDAVGLGPHRVLLEEWEGYYAARQLGWKIYRAGSPIPRNGYVEFIKSMDYVVIRDPKKSIMPQLNLENLKDAGFELQERIEFEQPQKSHAQWGPF